MSATSWLRYPRWRYAANCGIAIAARMPMIATTTRSSISVKPFCFFRFTLAKLRILSSLGMLVSPSSRRWVPLRASPVPRTTVVTGRPNPVLRQANLRARGPDDRAGERHNRDDRHEHDVDVHHWITEPSLK